MELVKQGAEAKIYNTVLFGTDVVVKERFSKAYRHPDLDKTLRTKQFANEVRSILKCSKLGLNVATVLWADVPNCRLFMKKISGVTVKQWLNDREADLTTKECKQVCIAMGECIAKLHGAGGMVHGDLTTSNFMVDDDNELFVLDFGLSYQSTDEEDFAVDLYVLERAMISTHANSESLFVLLLKSYEDSFKDGKGELIVKRLNAVRQRGRKKVAFG